MPSLRTLFPTLLIALAIILISKLDSPVQASPIANTAYLCTYILSTDSNPPYKPSVAQQCHAEEQVRYQSDWYDNMSESEIISGVVYEP